LGIAADYIHKVLDFYSLSIAHVGEGWQIRTDGYLRELRVPVSMGFPDLGRSKNLIGYQKSDQNYYLHLGPETVSTIFFSDKQNTLPYLVEANGRVIKFERHGKNVLLQLSGYLPLQFQLGNMQGCRLLTQEKMKQIATTESNITYQMENKDSHDLRIECQ
jgi:polysaccharide biosynthesis protein PelA